MRRSCRFLVIALTLALAGRAQAQIFQQTNYRPIFGRPAPGCCQPSQPGMIVEPAPIDPKQLPKVDPKAPVEAPVTGAFLDLAPAGTGGAQSFNPAMFGDLNRGSDAIGVLTLHGGATKLGRVATINRGSFKIADNESPRPTDRVFLSYSYFNNVSAGSGIPGYDVHRETFGFEKTFLDGNASFGLRLPFLQTTGTVGGLQGSQFGDLTMIFKYAFVNNYDTGDVLSAGLALTAPTGDDIRLLDGSTLNSWLFQPYVGYILNGDRFFIQGFSSLVIPTESHDVTLMFNDIGVGFWLYRNQYDRLVTGIAPTFEFHATTPLDHRSQFDMLRGIDVYTLTGGVNFVLGPKNSTLGMAIAVPISGPRIYDVEALVSFNWRF